VRTGIEARGAHVPPEWAQAPGDPARVHPLAGYREQRPLFDSNAPGHPRLRGNPGALPLGDYSVKGFEEAFAVERKQIADFYSYIGKERERTRYKMEAFKAACFRGGFAALVVEAEEKTSSRGYIMRPREPRKPAVKPSYPSRSATGYMYIAPLPSGHRPVDPGSRYQVLQSSTRGRLNMKLIASPNLKVLELSPSDLYPDELNRFWLNKDELRADLPAAVSQTDQA